MSENQLTNEEIFQIVRNLALAALRNHRTIEGASKQLSKTVGRAQEVTGNLAKSAAFEMHRQFSNDFNKIVEQASTAIEVETARKLDPVVQKAYHAAASYEKATRQTYWWVALMSGVIGALASLLCCGAFWYFRR